MGGLAGSECRRWAGLRLERGRHGGGIAGNHRGRATHHRAVDRLAGNWLWHHHLWWHGCLRDRGDTCGRHRSDRLAGIDRLRVDRRCQRGLVSVAVAAEAMVGTAAAGKDRKRCDKKPGLTPHNTQSPGGSHYRFRQVTPGGGRTVGLRPRQRQGKERAAETWILSRGKRWKCGPDGRQLPQRPRSPQRLGSAGSNRAMLAVKPCRQFCRPIGPISPWAKKPAAGSPAKRSCRQAASW